MIGRWSEDTMSGISMRRAFAPGVCLMVVLTFSASTGRPEVSSGADPELATGAPSESLQARDGSEEILDTKSAARPVGWFEGTQSEDPATMLRRAAVNCDVKMDLSRPACVSAGMRGRNPWLD